MTEYERNAVNKFIDKQGIKDKRITVLGNGLLGISDYYFSTLDIIWDVNSDQPKGNIFKWMDNVIEGPVESPTYFEYCKNK